MRYALRWIGLMCFLSLLAAGLAVALTGGIRSALAAPVLSNGPDGRAWNFTYFTNQFTPYPDYVLDPEGQTQYDGLAPGCGINACSMNAASFIEAYRVRLFDATSQVNQGRAAASIDIMLGLPGTTFNGSAAQGIAYAQAHFTQWADVVNLYDSGAIPGYSAQWNVDNLFYTSDAMGATIINPRAQCRGQVGLECVGDVTFVQAFNDSNVDVGVIFNANGKQLIIKYKCGNMEGTISYLPIPSTSVTITKSSSHPAPMAVGTSMDYTLDVRQADKIPLRQVTVTDVLPPEFRYDGPVAGSPAPAVNGNALRWDFSLPADSAILSAIETGTETLRFTVTAVAAGSALNTANGTATEVSGLPETVVPGSTTNVVLLGVAPAFVGLNSDVHAGGGPCGGQLSSGFVAGYRDAGSYATYAVSASGAVSNFSSNSGLNTLTLGVSGDYSEVCVPDLYAAAQSGFGDTPATVLAANSSANPYDISNWSGVYYINGNAYITDSSPVKNKMTIVALNGSIHVVGSITLSKAKKARSSVPSVGLIAANDIDIAASVGRVDAYMFADGLVDTCEPGTGSCSSTLTVNGFVMGGKILFARLGPPSSPNGVVAEKVALNPQLYLNPPTFFDSARTGGAALIGEGEKPPLF